MSEVPDIFAAVRAGDVDSVRSIVAADPAAAVAREAAGISPVMTAVYHGKQAIVDILLQSGVVPDVFEAAAVGDSGRLETLLSANDGPLSAFSPDGWQPLHLALFFHKNEAARLLLERGAPLEERSRNGMNVTPLQSALASGNEVGGKLLIERGADITVGSWTPLHYAAANNLPDTARVLLGRGADMGAENDAGKTPLALAEEKGNAATVALLRESSAA